MESPAKKTTIEKREPDQEERNGEILKSRWGKEKADHQLG